MAKGWMTVTTTSSSTLFAWPPTALCKHCCDEKQNHGDDNACLFAPGTYFESDLFLDSIVYPDPVDETTALPLTWTSNSTVGVATTGIAVDWVRLHGK